MRKKLSALSVAIAAATVTAASAGAKSAVRWPIEHIEITARFDTAGHKLTGTAKMTLPRKGAKAAGFLLNRELAVEGATIGGEVIELERHDSFAAEDVSPRYGVFGRWEPEKARLWTANIPKSAGKKVPLIFEIKYSGSLYFPPDERQFSRERIAFEVDGTIGGEGIFLSSSSFWYPQLPDILATHTVTARLPEGWSCVTNGLPVKSETGDGWVEMTWVSEDVIPALAFSAGPYVVKTIEHQGTLISTYLMPPQAELADGYLEACCRYIDMYGGLIAPYPFPCFAVVDNFLPTGYGMPGWTLLGSEVLRLPFIKETSLGHEVLHNWFGNSLFVDYREGNWCEGLTTYLADYRFKEDGDSAAATEYRRDLLRDYAAYVNEDNEYPLCEFSERAEPWDRAIGYGKGMMVFHMLRRMLDQVDPGMFLQVVRETYAQYRWQPIGWDVWQREFERRLGQRLDWFFEQWVRMPGAPQIAIENVSPSDADGGWDLLFEVVTQTGNPQPLQYMLEVRAITDIGEVDYNPFIRDPRQRVDMSGPGELRAVMLDPAFDLFRMIYPGEVPVTMADFFGDPDGVLVVPGRRARASEYRSIAEGLKAKGQEVVADSDFSAAHRDRSLWIIGTPEENGLWGRHPPDPARLAFFPYVAPRWKEEQPVPVGLELRGEEFRGGRLTATIVSRHPDAESKVIVHTLSLPGADPTAGMRKLPHYGKYSYLLFDDEDNIRKGVWAVSGKSPMVWQAGDE